MNKLPDKIISFLKNAIGGTAGTRSASLEPFAHTLSSWYYVESTGMLELSFSEGHSHQLLANLEDNGEIAVSLAEMPSHESYQFKGKFIESRACSAEDIKIFEAKNLGFIEKVVTMFGVPREIAEKLYGEPSLTIVIKPETIFDQTPENELAS